jgi:hypothetical protein
MVELFRMRKAIIHHQQCKNKSFAEDSQVGQQKK